MEMTTAKAWARLMRSHVPRMRRRPPRSRATAAARWAASSSTDRAAARAIPLALIGPELVNAVAVEAVAAAFPIAVVFAHPAALVPSDAPKVDAT